VDVELYAQGSCSASTLETIVSPIAKLLQPVIELEIPMKIDWVEVQVLRAIDKLKASQHPESIVTYPHDSTK
jgi:hypothetical protein